MNAVDIRDILNKNFQLFEIRGIVFAPNLVQAVLIVLLLFALVMTLARLRHMYVKWSFKAAYAFIFIGFLLALILEGFLLLGGRTILSSIIGWKNPPEPLEKVLDVSREKMVKVLQIEKEIPQSNAIYLDAEDFVNLFEKLEDKEASRAKELICK